MSGNNPQPWTDKQLEELTDKQLEELYDRIRSKIEHEDNLVNQRIMWMITLQGLLFTAYGFSLSAEASSLSVSNSNPEAHKIFISTLTTLRQAMVAVGMGSSLAALLGVVAADRAIRDDERILKRHQKSMPKTVLKDPIGQRFTNILGMICGLAIPFLGGVAWMWIGGFLPNPLIVLTAVILMAVTSLALLPFLNSK